MYHAQARAAVGELAIGAGLSRGYARALYLPAQLGYWA
jgi:hypothetical protein